LIHDHQLRYYILDADGNLHTTTDMELWANWFYATDKRKVAWTNLGDKGEVRTDFVSTLAMPLLLPEWETMHFDVNGESIQAWKWYSLEAARKGHDLVVEAIKNGDVNDPEVSETLGE
jgi:hypothetical protein